MISWTSKSIGVARILSAGVHFFFTRNLMTFFLVITLSYTVIYFIYHHELPFSTFLSRLRGCTSPNSVPIFVSSQQRMPRNFFHRPGGAPAPPAPPLAKQCKLTYSSKTGKVRKWINLDCFLGQARGLGGVLDHL